MEAQIQSGNIMKVRTLFEGMDQRDPVLATKYIDPQNFINHNTHAADGIAGVRAFVSHLPLTEGPSRIVRLFEDGSYVITHSQADVFGDKVCFDIFRFEHGNIAEHWDNLDGGHTSQ